MNDGFLALLNEAIGNASYQHPESRYIICYRTERLFVSATSYRSYDGDPHVAGGDTYKIVTHRGRGGSIQVDEEHRPETSINLLFDLRGGDE